MKKIKIGLLARIVIAIILGIAIDTFFPAPLVRIFLYIFGIFLNMTHSGQVYSILMVFIKIIGVIFALHIFLLVFHCLYIKTRLNYFIKCCRLTSRHWAHSLRQPPSP